MTIQQNKAVRVTAIVTLTQTQAGGRISAIADGYRPHVRLSGIDGFASVKLGANETLAPGMTRNVEVVMVGSAAFVDAIAEGKSFTMHEGPKVVGSGVISRTMTADS